MGRFDDSRSIFKSKSTPSNIYESDNSYVANKLVIWKRLFPDYYFSISVLSYRYDHTNIRIPVIIGVSPQNEFHFAFIFEIFKKEYTEFILTYVNMNKNTKTAPKILTNNSFFEKLKCIFYPLRFVKFSKRIYIFSDSVCCSRKKIVSIFRTNKYFIQFK